MSIDRSSERVVDVCERESDDDDVVRKREVAAGRFVVQSLYSNHSLLLTSSTIDFLIVALP